MTHIAGWPIILHAREELRLLRIVFPKLYPRCPHPTPTSVSSQWGVCYATDNISQFQDILYNTMQTVLLLVVLDQLRLVNPCDWFERYLDSISVQAALVTSEAAGIQALIRKHMKAMARVGGGG